MMTGLGMHYLIDLHGCSVELITDTEFVRQAMLEAARRSGAQIVTDVFHTFNPYGVSGVVVIAESHLAVHTWPEYACASVDVFTCGEKMSPLVVGEFLSSVFRASDIKCQMVERGVGARVPPLSKVAEG